MEELGPFRVNSDGKTLYLNPFAWNKGKQFVSKPKRFIYRNYSGHLDYHLETVFSIILKIFNSILSHKILNLLFKSII